VIHKNEISILHADNSMNILINGQNLSDIFSGFRVEYDVKGNREVWLKVQGNIKYTELRVQTDNNTGQKSHGAYAKTFTDT